MDQRQRAIAADGNAPPRKFRQADGMIDLVAGDAAAAAQFDDREAQRTGIDMGNDALSRRRKNPIAFRRPPALFSPTLKL